ncbi:acetyltransferase [Lacinutrix iliipiscaria]|uniref:Acetyltransferase n=1 Tax=Lacinutrix iliipiscaria TaxID=1230532 RepID=A0ABW5WN09_9FLAO
MLIVGAKGFAKEVLETFHQSGDIENLVFYDDVNTYTSKKMYDKFEILQTLQEAESYFKTIDNRFVLGLGNPVLRKIMTDKFLELKGVLTSTISQNAIIGSFDVSIGDGSNILDHAIVSNGVTIGICAIIYYNAIITHDVKIGDFVEISPGAKLLGRSKIGHYSQIGCNATILPDVVIGHNVIVAAGAVVTKDVPNNSMVAGIPAVIKKELKPIEI